MASQSATRRAAAKTNYVADATAQSARAQLQYGSTYEGTVVSMGINAGVFGVKLDTPETVLNCLYAPFILSAMLGLKCKCILPLGTRVEVVYGTMPAITGCLTYSDGNPGTRDKHTVAMAQGLRAGLSTFQQTNTALPNFNGVDYPGDLLPGELDLTNIFQTGIQLLMNIAKVQAGDHAKVECHLLTDMVRIISKVFRHHSSFGDHEVFDDGRLNDVMHGTSNPWEAWGILNPTDQKLKNDNTGVDFSSVDAINATGRWRFSRYLGFLGNFIHIFVTDPTAVLGTIGSTVVRSGKFNAHVDMDGSLCVSSVADIVFERVVRIPVPIQCKRMEDPTGTVVTDFEKLDQRFLKLWNYPQNPLNLFETSYQLREYARYLTQFQAYSRFLQTQAKGGDYKVPSEQDTPAPDWTGANPDTSKANTALPYKFLDTYSTMRVTRDGSIIHWDGYGSATVHSHGDVEVSATRNLRFQAAGDISMVAGQNIYLNARRNTEITSISGGLKIKARAFMQLLCEWGTLWIKSDAQDPSDPNFQAPTPDNQTEDPEVIYNDAAVLIESSKGRTTLDSSRTLLLSTRGQPDPNDQGNADGISASVVVQSEHQHVKLRSGESVFLQALNGLIGLKSVHSFIVEATGAWFNMQGDFRLGNALSLGISGVIKCNQLYSNVIASIGAIFGPKIPGPSPSGSGAEGGVQDHFNHILKLPDDTSAYNPVPDAPEDSVLNDTASLNQLKSQPETLFPEKGELTFKFDAFTDYVPDPFIFMESHAQQYLRLDLPGVWTQQYDVASAGAITLKSAPRVDNTTAPFPGVRAQQRQHTGGDNLRVPSSKSGTDLNSQTALENAQYQLRFLKRSGIYNP